ncbi:TetR/AcrR family transcriptional regulator [Burkholderia sp. FERM BP-3421]|jgi:AcrR family transcriptional regulator|uniref:TetR/AcrR family transcriptional regulator n=1 Tax=Burkholderia sp. FERM BP-3421 TaxID=1494466 RepID=UPI002360B59C|nr:TetR/AcrR family transcriptional regulator [Burkholderia sp. FERM BP-3421]WDD93681.1 TetR/AcrR family transcriptional regulator [Burkholderia sp. FERM BP-3421]
MAERGRPRRFDRDEALARAMELFWARGYEATSMADLTAAMGVAAPSLYAAFGGKDALFRAVVERYLCTDGRHVLDALDAPGAVRDALGRTLMTAAWSLTLEARPRGCLVVLGALPGEVASEEACALLREQRRAFVVRLRDHLARALREGELPAGASVDALAEYFVTVLYGMSIQARDGASRAQLEGVARTALMAWPAA